MKKTIAILFSGVLLFASTFAAIFRGDANGDGRISVTDLTAVSSYILGNITEGIVLENVDVNGDNRISVADLTSISTALLEGSDEIIPIEDVNIVDTLFLSYSNEQITVFNPNPSAYTVAEIGKDVEVRITGANVNHTISVSGRCDDGRLRIIADTTYTLELAGVELTSSHAPAINSSNKQKMNLFLKNETINKLADAKKFVFADTLEQANACLCNQGAITVMGEGVLEVVAKSKHAIASGKTMRLNEGKIKVTSAPSDAFHSGKSIIINGGEYCLWNMQGEGFDMNDDFQMSGGFINMTISGEAAKGIKCSGIMTITDGVIEANAAGNLKNKKGDLSYCNILKSDSIIDIKGGTFNLVNFSEGGRCISADSDVLISGGTLYLQTSGQGGEYVNEKGDNDYYTAKCISAGNDVFITNGNIACVSLGTGGKGIVGDHWVIIGEKDIVASNPTLLVKTKGESLINDTIRDERFGCPKGIKAGERLYVYGGNTHVKTEGMGGEGLESKGAIFVYDGTVNCETYDDGINAETKFHVFGGEVFCISENNDGIDSNGNLSIEGGVVVSISRHVWDESLDAENGVSITGGVVFGIGKDDAKIKPGSSPLYNTNGHWNDYTGKEETEWSLTQGHYYHLMDDDNLIMTLMCNHTDSDVFLTLHHDCMIEGKEYSIYESTEAINPEETYFNGIFTIGGTCPANRILVGTININNKEQEIQQQ